MTEKDLEIQELRQKLKGYEDTGLTPEEIHGLCSLEKRGRMAKMLRWEEAEKDGRLMILPCTVGQKIYAVGSDKDGIWQIKECYADTFVIDRVIVNFDCDNDCKGCPFNSWAQEYSGEWSCDGEYGQSTIGFEAFGDWIFLTREEAAEALKGGTDSAY